MYLQDKILKIREVKKAEKVSGTFYVSLYPSKDEPSRSFEYLKAKPLLNEAECDVPLNVGEWNPVVLGAADITAELLAKYRIFIGEE